jgi:hypothetical protein
VNLHTIPGIYNDRKNEKKETCGGDYINHGKDHGTKPQPTKSNKRPATTAAADEDLRGTRPESSKRPRQQQSSKSSFSDSAFAKQGVDMRASEKNNGDLLKIFPSLSRGRGRGRGYM